MGRTGDARLFDDLAAFMTTRGLAGLELGDRGAWAMRNSPEPGHADGYRAGALVAGETVELRPLGVVVAVS